MRASVLALALAASARAADLARVPTSDLRVSSAAAGLLVAAPREPARELALGAAERAYWERLGARDRLRFAKAAAVCAGGAPPSPRALMHKRGGRFHLEGCAAFPVPFEKARPAIADFGGYAGWAFDRINRKRRDPAESYMLRLDSLDYLAAEKAFRVRMRLERFFKGKYRLDLELRDGLGDPVAPRIGFALKTPSRLVSALSGELVFFRAPGARGFSLHFSGEAKSHWAFYYLVPMALLRTDGEERVLTVLENAWSRIAPSGK